MRQPDFDLYGAFTQQLREFESWTLEDAKAAERDWMKSKGVEYPHQAKAGVSPLDQWITWTRRLPSLKAKFEDSIQRTSPQAGEMLKAIEVAELSWRQNPTEDNAEHLAQLRLGYEVLQGKLAPLGDFKFVFDAVTECITSRLPLPAWCAVPIRKAYNKIDSFEANCWDDVFGKPHPGKQLSRAKQRREKETSAVSDVLELADQGDPIVASLELVADRYGISYELLRGWYYDHLKQFPVTEVLRTDGWYYRKETGKPDSEFKKHHRVGE